MFLDNSGCISLLYLCISELRGDSEKGPGKRVAVVGQWEGSGSRQQLLIQAIKVVFQHFPNGTAMPDAK